MNNTARGWHGRGYLPHLELTGRATGITFRLADSLPKDVIEKLKDLCDGADNSEQNRELSRKIAAYEDAGMGRCWLRHDECARIVAESIGYFDGDRYDLIEWCVMPNHVHVILSLRQNHGFEKIVRSWKNYSARKINSYTGQTGRLWAMDYFDRVIRDEEHLAKARR